MKRILFSLLLLSNILCVTAKIKVVESSERRAPSWVGAFESGYIIVSAEAETQDQAKQLCLARVKQEIVNAVAVTVSSQEQLAELSVDTNGNEAYQSVYASNIQSIAAQLPYISGISLDENGEAYWQQCYDTKDKSKTRYYMYHVKYYFPSTEREKLIRQYKLLDQEQVEKLAALRAEYNTFTQVEYISKAITEITPIINFFNDNKRKEEAQALQSSYRKLYSEIAIEPISNELGVFTYKLVLHGRTMTTSLRPKMRSDYAYNMEYRPLDENCHTICYDHEGCIETDPNRVYLTYSIGGKSIKYDFPFDVRDTKVHLLPQGTLLIEAQPEATLAIDMSLRSKYDTPFVVKALSLVVPSVNRQIVIEEIDQPYATKGNCTLRVKTSEKYSLGSELEGVAQGELTILNTATETTQQVKFAILYKINCIK